MDFGLPTAAAIRQLADGGIVETMLQLRRKGSSRPPSPTKRVQPAILPKALKPIQQTHQVRTDRETESLAAGHVFRDCAMSSFADSTFDPVFGVDGLLTLQPKARGGDEILARDPLELYLEAAYSALDTVNTFDTSAADVIYRVIKWLVTDARVKPEEIVRYKEMADHALLAAAEQEKTATALRAEKDALSLEIQTMKESLDVAQQDLFSARLELEAAHADNKRLETELQNLRAELNDQMRAFQELQTARDKIAKRNTELVGTGVALRTQIEDFLLMQQEYQRCQQVHDDEVQQLRCELDRAKRQYDEDIASYQHIVGSKTDVIADLTNQCSVTKNELTNLREKVAYLQDKLISKNPVSASSFPVEIPGNGSFQDTFDHMIYGDSPSQTHHGLLASMTGNKEVPNVPRSTLPRHSSNTSEDHPGDGTNVEKDDSTPKEPLVPQVYDSTALERFLVEMYALDLEKTRTLDGAENQRSVQTASLAIRKKLRLLEANVTKYKGLVKADAAASQAQEAGSIDAKPHVEVDGDPVDLTASTIRSPGKSRDKSRKKSPRKGKPETPATTRPSLSDFLSDLTLLDTLSDAQKAQLLEYLKNDLPHPPSATSVVKSSERSISPEQKSRPKATNQVSLVQQKDDPTPSSKNIPTSRPARKSPAHKTQQNKRDMDTGSGAVLMTPTRKPKRDASQLHSDASTAETRGDTIGDLSQIERRPLVSDTTNKTTEAEKGRLTMIAEKRDSVAASSEIQDGQKKSPRRRSSDAITSLDSLGNRALENREECDHRGDTAHTPHSRAHSRGRADSRKEGGDASPPDLVATLRSSSAGLHKIALDQSTLSSSPSPDEPGRGSWRRSGAKMRGMDCMVIISSQTNLEPQLTRSQVTVRAEQKERRKYTSAADGTPTVAPLKKERSKLAFKDTSKELTSTMEYDTLSSRSDESGVNEDDETVTTVTQGTSRHVKRASAATSAHGCPLVNRGIQCAILTALSQTVDRISQPSLSPQELEEEPLRIRSFDIPLKDLHTTEEMLQSLDRNITEGAALFPNRKSADPGGPMIVKYKNPRSRPALSVQGKSVSGPLREDGTSQGSSGGSSLSRRAPSVAIKEPGTGKTLSAAELVVRANRLLQKTAPLLTEDPDPLDNAVASILFQSMGITSREGSSAHANRSALTDMAILPAPDGDNAEELVRYIQTLHQEINKLVRPPTEPKSVQTLYSIPLAPPMPPKMVTRYSQTSRDNVFFEGEFVFANPPEQRPSSTFLQGAEDEPMLAKVEEQVQSQQPPRRSNASSILQTDRHRDDLGDGRGTVTVPLGSLESHSTPRHTVVEFTAHVPETSYCVHAKSSQDTVYQSELYTTSLVDLNQEPTHTVSSSQELHLDYEQALAIAKNSVANTIIRRKAPGQSSPRRPAAMDTLSLSTGDAPLEGSLDVTVSGPTNDYHIIGSRAPLMNSINIASFDSSSAHTGPKTTNTPLLPTIAAYKPISNTVEPLTVTAVPPPTGESMTKPPILITNTQRQMLARISGDGRGVPQRMQKKLLDYPTDEMQLLSSDDQLLGPEYQERVNSRSAVIYNPDNVPMRPHSAGALPNTRDAIGEHRGENNLIVESFFEGPRDVGRPILSPPSPGASRPFGQGEVSHILSRSTVSPRAGLSQARFTTQELLDGTHALAPGMVNLFVNSTRQMTEINYAIQRDIAPRLTQGKLSPKRVVAVSGGETPRTRRGRNYWTPRRAIGGSLRKSTVRPVYGTPLNIKTFTFVDNKPAWRSPSSVNVALRNELLRQRNELAKHIQQLEAELELEKNRANNARLNPFILTTSYCAGETLPDDASVGSPASLLGPGPGPGPIRPADTTHDMPETLDINECISFDRSYDYQRALERLFEVSEPLPDGICVSQLTTPQTVQGYRAKFKELVPRVRTEAPLLIPDTYSAESIPGLLANVGSAKVSIQLSKDARIVLALYQDTLLPGASGQPNLFVDKLLRLQEKGVGLGPQTSQSSHQTPLLRYGDRLIYVAVPGTIRIKSLPWLLRLIRTFYAELAGQLQSYILPKRADVAQCIIAWAHKKYTLGNLVQNLLWHFYCSATYYAEMNAEVATFLRVLSGEYEAPQLAFLINVRRLLRIDTLTGDEQSMENFEEIQLVTPGRALSMIDILFLSIPSEEKQRLEEAIRANVQYDMAPASVVVHLLLQMSIMRQSIFNVCICSLFDASARGDGPIAERTVGNSTAVDILFRAWPYLDKRTIQRIVCEVGSTYGGLKFEAFVTILAGMTVIPPAIQDPLYAQAQVIFSSAEAQAVKLASVPETAQTVDTLETVRRQVMVALDKQASLQAYVAASDYLREVTTRLAACPDVN
ncbi:hypothetical protein GMRT_13360 [Giardia muris]|uniref:Uncharacterized protein n=1 Tax=Giardia muris TaxID=5742 RepID=A0A4Z1SKZ4_GIAMU|nr:hypothetical protein GMRT_13360 [Giardia muris]|eukprot:TNJ26326.1 hypothetical protein GMRT_13360 [Giardia muris]